MRIIAFPKSGVAYNNSFYRSIEKQGVCVLEGVFSGSWLIKNIQKNDWIHLHWPSFEYKSSRGKVSSLISFLRFFLLLILIRIKKAKIAWTAHNLLPHDRNAIPWLDLIARRIVIAFSSVIPVHGNEAYKLVSNRFQSAKNKLVTIPHGNWIGVYPSASSKHAFRKSNGITQAAYVFLFIGGCKPYKNLDGLVECFKNVSGNVILLIAGIFQDPAYLALIQSMSSSDPRIKIFPGFIPDEKMAAFLDACDAVVVPYREILTSGTAMLAISHGRPVLSVNLGFLREFILNDIGLLYSQSDPDGLYCALQKMPSLSFNEETIRLYASQFTFDNAAQIFLKAIKNDNIT